jgi:hypothetical protein
VGNLRDPTVPSASSLAPLASPVSSAGHALEASVSPGQDTVTKHRKLGIPPDVRFAEFFAGDAQLTSTMEAAGVHCLPPNDLASGGTDFESSSQVKAVKEALRSLRTADSRLVLHLAPPCSTFSQARDISRATRLRSAEHPGGLPDLTTEQRRDADSANTIARHTFELAKWAAKELRAVVCIEDPLSSYMWLYIDSLRTPLSSSSSPGTDIVVSQCLFGTPYRKDWAVFDAPLTYKKLLVWGASEPTSGYHASLLERVGTRFRTPVLQTQWRQHMRPSQARGVGIWRSTYGAGRRLSSQALRIPPRHLPGLGTRPSHFGHRA